mmetsp:Transcript_62881/g.180909  ORF Transcript_62881/g.180909 Transcript_62881/m.180909 type:complete len:278 (-) Transcript_62881:27-860(-)
MRIGVFPGSMSTSAVADTGCSWITSLSTASDSPDTPRPPRTKRPLSSLSTRNRYLPPLRMLRNPVHRTMTGPSFSIAWLHSLLAAVSWKRSSRRRTSCALGSTEPSALMGGNFCGRPVTVKTSDISPWSLGKMKAAAGIGTSALFESGPIHLRAKRASPLRWKYSTLKGCIPASRKRVALTSLRPMLHVPLSPSSPSSNHVENGSHPHCETKQFSSIPASHSLHCSPKATLLSFSNVSGTSPNFRFKTSSRVVQEGPGQTPCPMMSRAPSSASMSNV